MDLKFRNVYSYFMHDIDEINRLEEEALLILRKKNLDLEGISEEQYIGKLEQMGEHIGNTLEQVTQSLFSIVSFQNKLE